MNPVDRITLRPASPDDELNIEERVKLIQNGLVSMKTAINDSLGNVHALLTEIRDDMKAAAANTGVIRNTVRRHSERLRAIEVDMDKLQMNGDKHR